MSSYIILAVRVDVNIDKALDLAHKLTISCNGMKATLTGVTVLNTIPAP